MWDEELNDKEMSVRMHDEGFYDFLRESLRELNINVLTIGKEQWANSFHGYCQIINNTGQRIRWSDYTVTVSSTGTEWVDSVGGYRPVVYERTVHGIDIPPHGRHNVEIHGNTGRRNAPEKVTAINLSISADEHG